MSKNVEHQMKGENLDMGDKLLRSSLHNSKVNIRKVYIKSIKSKCNKMGFDNDKKGRSVRPFKKFKLPKLCCTCREKELERR